MAGRDEYIQGPYTVSQFVYFRKVIANMGEAKAAFTDLTVLTLRKRSELAAIIQQDANPERTRALLGNHLPEMPQV